MMAMEDQAQCWWWTHIYKVHAPKKSNILMWLMIMNKVPTWDLSQKKQKHGLGICYLWKSIDEDVSHLFSQCPYAFKVWKDIGGWLGINNIWQGDFVEEGLRCLFTHCELNKCHFIPFITIQGIWLAHNSNLFEDRFQYTFESHHKYVLLHNSLNLLGRVQSCE